jgi:FkbM family methyltransferase
VINVLGGKEYPYRLYKHLIHKNSIIIDIGGHIGTFVLYLRKHSPYGKIYVFEPDSENIDMLQKNMHLNNIKNVYIEKKAVADHDGYLRFQANVLNKNEGHIIKSGGIQVEAIKLDTYVKQKSIDHIDLLKLDCEGAEYQILKSFKNLHICRSLMIEYHHTVPGKNMNKQWIISHMTSNNFKLLYSVVTGANDICGKLYFENNAYCNT